MLLVIGHLRFPAAARAGVLAALADVIAETRAEPGCLFYDFAEDVLEPNVFRVSEGWRDTDALRHHFASAHMERFRTARETLGMAERVVTIYASEGTVTL